MFVDPAANLYFGNGFISSTWFAQTKDEFWAGYPFLHAFLLYLWMQLFGFGLYTAHSLNWLLIVVCTLMLWKSVIRLNIVKSARLRLILITLVLLQLAYISNGEKGRPDILMACLAIASLLVYSIRISWLRYILLTFLCALFPLSGLALLAYALVISSLILIYLKKSFLKDFAFIISGLIIGCLSIYIFYSINGVWDGFVASIINNPTLLNSSQRYKFGGLFGNKILSISMILCFILVVYKLIKNQFIQFSILSFGAILILWVPIGMRLAGAFQTSYSWMLVIPLIVCIVSSLDVSFITGFEQRMKLSILGLLLILCLVCSPYTNFVNICLNWSSYEYLPVENFVQHNIKKNELIYSDSIAYFATKQGGRMVIWYPYLNVISNKESQKIDVLIIRAQDIQILKNKLRGSWYKTGKILIVRDKENSVKLEIYRKEPV